MCPFSVATILQRFFLQVASVSPDHDWKYPFLIYLVHAHLTGLIAAAWRYLTKYV